MDKEKIKQIIRSAAQIGCFASPRHCRERMKQRNVTIDDFLLVLLWGEIIKIEQNIEHYNHKVRIKEKDTDGGELTIVAAVCENDHTVIWLTVFDRK